VRVGPIVLANDIERSRFSLTVIQERAACGSRVCAVVVWRAVGGVAGHLRDGCRRSLLGPRALAR
jgi:hypothetical protein